MKHFLWGSLMLISMLTGIDQSPPKVTLQFQNGSNQTGEKDVLTITSDTSFKGALYSDQEVYYAFKKEDWNNKKLSIPIDHEGWYSLFDEEDHYLGYAVFGGEDVLFGFDQRLYHKENTHYLFKQAPKLLIYSLEQLDLPNFSCQNHIYTSQEPLENLVLNNENYLFLSDQKDPSISIDAYQLEADTYLLSKQKQVKISKRDEMFAYFDAPEGWIKTEDDCYEMQFAYSEEQPLDEKIFQDYVGNGKSKKFVVDENAPSVDFFKQTEQLTIEVNDEYLDVDSLSSISLFFYDIPIPLTIENNQLFAPLYQDGRYHWQGTIKDLAGNELILDEWQMVDQRKPSISLDEGIYPVALSPFTINLTIYDEFIQSYRVWLYREDQLLSQLTGIENTCLTIDLDDSDYDDGGGCYYLIVEVSDTIQTIQQTFQWQMDMGCSPIILSFNGVRGDAVEEIVIHQPLEIKARCKESSVSYQVWQNQKIICEGQDFLILQPGWHATNIVFQAEDSYGHKQERQILIEDIVEQLDESFIEETKDKELEDDDIRKIVKPVKDIPVRPRVSENTHSHLPLWIGGGIIALGLMRLFYVAYLRSGKATADDMENNAATVVISDKTTH